MVYVTDTHALIWYLTGDKKIGKNAKSVFHELEKGRGKLIVSLVVLLEALVLVEKRRVSFTWEELGERIARFPTAIIYPVGLDLLQEIRSLGRSLELHDRILVTTAKIHDAVLITKDPKITKIKVVKIIW